MEAQKFGGSWSLVKIETVAEYLKFFNTALQYQPSMQDPFKRIYIDAFAGSGEFTFGTDNSGTEEVSLFGQSAPRETYAGSAKRALLVNPPFHEIILIEREPKNVAALKTMVAGDKRVQIRQGDANSEVLKIKSEYRWHMTRGVIFLDPFGNSVEWSTLEAIAQNTKLDVWYLFPLAGLFRNAPHNFEKLTPDKHNSITKILGTADWEESFYREPPASNYDLFGQRQTSKSRDMNVNGMEAFVKRRLEKVFPLVLGPKRLRNDRGAPLFSLFFAMSNKTDKARALAQRMVKPLLDRM